MITLNSNEVHTSQEYVQEDGETKWAAAQARLILACAVINLSGNETDGYTSSDVTIDDTNKNIIIFDNNGDKTNGVIMVNDDDPDNLIVKLYIDETTLYNLGDYSDVAAVFFTPSLSLNVFYVNDLGDYQVEELEYLELTNKDTGFATENSKLCYDIPVTPIIANKIKFTITSQQDNLGIEECNIKTYTTSNINVCEFTQTN